MDGFERFEEEFLPPKERFYNSLKDIRINDKGYYMQRRCLINLDV